MSALARGLICLAAIYVFFFYVPELYGSFDGQFVKHHVIDKLRWLTPLQVNALNPYQGTANVWFHTSSWLNPGYAIFALIPDLRLALPASYTIFVSMYAGATCLFARVIAPGIRLAWPAGLVAAFAVFPPLGRVFGLYPVFEIVPGGAYYVAICLVLLALLMQLGNGRIVQQTTLGLAIAGIALFGIVCDPLWMQVLVLSAMPFGIAALVVDLRWRAILFRSLVCIVIAVAFFALGIVDYLAGISRYTSRFFFWRESAGMSRVNTFLFFGLQNSRGFATAVVLLAGFLFAGIWGSARVRVMALACILSMAFLFAYSIAYLTVRVPWPYPLPLYVEMIALPIYFVVAGIGWGAAARRATAGRAGAPKEAIPVRGPAVAEIWAAPAALVALAIWSLTTFYPNERPELRSIGARTSPIEIVQILIDETALEPGASFRGSTAGTRDVSRRYDDYKSALGHALYYPDLWAQRVPTFHEYSQLATPAMYYLVSRLFGTPPFDPRNNTPSPEPTPKGIDVLRALGVRFLLSGRELDLKGTLRARWSGQDIEAFLYELQDTNLGNYSPTRVVTRVGAPDVIAELGRPDIDFRKEVLLEQAQPNALVPARSARLVFERGWARVQAQSDGVSLVLLPIQFSHCLALEGGDAKLVRANFVQSGLIFRGAIDVRLNYLFSPLRRSECRNADLQDMWRAGLPAEVKPAEPDWPTFAPWSSYPWQQAVKGRLTQLIRGDD